MELVNPLTPGGGNYHECDFDPVMARAAQLTAARLVVSADAWSIRAGSFVNSTLEATVKYLADRQAILDCLSCYARGIDRMDRVLALSAYHCDAIDDHGPFVGPAEAFVDWALAFHSAHQVTHHHIISNFTVEIDGNTAHAETYYAFIGENTDGRGALAFGRYLDRLECREGRWAIAFRRCINEGAFKLESAGQPAEWLARMRSSGPSRRDREDASYDRPLTATRQTVDS